MYVSYIACVLVLEKVNLTFYDVLPYVNFFILMNLITFHHITKAFCLMMA